VLISIFPPALNAPRFSPRSLVTKIPPAFPVAPAVVTTNCEAVVAPNTVVSDAVPWRTINLFVPVPLLISAIVAPVVPIVIEPAVAVSLVVSAALIVAPPVVSATVAFANPTEVPFNTIDPLVAVSFPVAPLALAAPVVSDPVALPVIPPTASSVIVPELAVSLPAVSATNELPVRIVLFTAIPAPLVSVTLPDGVAVPV